jgi:hypothetical protein
MRAGVASKILVMWDALGNRVDFVLLAGQRQLSVISPNFSFQTTFPSSIVSMGVLPQHILRSEEGVVMGGSNRLWY